MTDAIAIISKVLPVIFLIIAGSIFKKTGFIRQSTMEELKKIVICISLPSMLFVTFAETNFESRYMLIFITIFTLCVLMLFLGMLLNKVLKSDNKYSTVLFSGFETGMMGYSLYVSVFGTENAYKLAIMDIGQVTFVFLILLSFLQKLNGKSFGIKQLILSFLRSPIILSILSGIVIGSTGLTESLKSFPVSNSILTLLNLLSNLTVPIICFCIGYELHMDFKHIGKPFLVALLRLIILAAAARAINDLLIEGVLKLDESFKIALYTMFILPPPFVIPIFMAEGESRNKQFILNTISISTILSLGAYNFLVLVT